MQIKTNTRVETPFGPGIVQGATDTNPPKWLVRVPIHDDNRHALSDPRCWTPKANHLALFVFPEEDLK